MKITTHSPEETIDAAKKLGSMLHAGDIIAYKGGLGAGKTTFINILIRQYKSLSGDIFIDNINISIIIINMINKSRNIKL